MILAARSDILSELGTFLSDLFKDFAGGGTQFFGGPLDIALAFLDVVATTLVVYYLLRILRDSRAWQLLKGLLLIVTSAVVFSLVGLNTVGFLLNNTISVLAIALVVIFQPELRRALETVGRSSFNVFSSAILSEDKAASSGAIHNLIESIVRACEKLTQTRTGALIVIERQTRLGELFEQENVVQMDAAISATMLLQIFYKGSPLHDGAVLIRDGRVAAARVHVPLSDNPNLRRDYGTRHRAAIGVSEIGDALAVVVSEERGTISLALEGRLYSLENGDALRSLLHKLLAPAKTSGNGIGSLIRGQRTRRNLRGNLSTSSDTRDYAPLTSATIHAYEQRSAIEQTPRQAQTERRRRLPLLIASFAIAIVLWMYVQVTVNPIETRVFTVDLSTSGVEQLHERGLDVMIPSQSIRVTVSGRRRTVSNLSNDVIKAYIDFKEVDQPQLLSLPVKVSTSQVGVGATNTDPVNIPVVVTRRTSGGVTTGS